MKKSELRDAVEGIHLSEEVKWDMIRNIKEKTGKEQRAIKSRKWQKAAAAAAIVIAAGGVIAFPVRAFINDYFISQDVQLYMEDMAEEESKKMLDDIDSPGYNGTEADSYSREYTENEKERMQSLYQQYKQGVFPEKGIQKAYSEEEAAQYEFCYLINGRRFCLPERELTDEEILEIIDLDLKTDYVFKERSKDELAQIREREKSGMEAAIAEGGITEEQAIEIAGGYLQDIYGTTEEGLDLLSHYDFDDNLKEEGCYLVEWSNAPLYDRSYHFYIRAKDGQLTGTDHAGEDFFEQEGIKTEEAEGKIPELYEKAAAFMKEKMGISFEKEYVYYETYEKDGITTGNTVKFIFSKEGSGIYEVEYLWNGSLHSYWNGGSYSHREFGTDFSEYENGKISYQNNKFVISTFRQLESN